MDNSPELDEPNATHIPAPPAEMINAEDADPHANAHGTPIIDQNANSDDVPGDIPLPGNDNGDDNEVGTMNSQKTGVESMDSASTGVDKGPVKPAQPTTEEEHLQAAVDDGGLSVWPTGPLQHTHHPAHDPKLHYSWALITDILDHSQLSP